MIALCIDAAARANLCAWLASSTEAEEYWMASARRWLELARTWAR
jgi:hypothetical protein